MNGKRLQYVRKHILKMTQAQFAIEFGLPHQSSVFRLESRDHRTLSLWDAVKAYAIEHGYDWDDSYIFSIPEPVVEPDDENETPEKENGKHD